MSSDYDPSHYRFARRAKRLWDGERLVFDNALPPLRPYWKDLLWVAAVAAAFVIVIMEIT